MIKAVRVHKVGGPEALVYDFNVGIPIIAALCAIAAYIVGSHSAIRLIKSFKA